MTFIDHMKSISCQNPGQNLATAVREQYAHFQNQKKVGSSSQKKMVHNIKKMVHDQKNGSSAHEKTLSS